MTVEQLRQLEQAATPAPWEHNTHPMVAAAVDAQQPDNEFLWRPVLHRDDFASEDDYRLIAAMRNALPALLDIAEAAQRHHYHVNDEWERLAEMRPQDPVTWERWEAIRERLLDELAAALSRLDDR